MKCEKRDGNRECAYAEVGFYSGTYACIWCNKLEMIE